MLNAGSLDVVGVVPWIDDGHPSLGFLSSLGRQSSRNFVYKLQHRVKVDLFARAKEQVGEIYSPPG
jgi:hypothetical protein